VALERGSIKKENGVERAALLKKDTMRAEWGGKVLAN
jgi:hypothetical protein